MASNARPPYGGTVYRGGSSGPDVALIQRWLNGARSRWPAIRPVTVDGKYGSATATAVKTFQRLEGIRDDGTVGPETWEHLYDVYATLHGEGEIWPGITMEQGHHGSTVKSAQERLRNTVPTLSTDGAYGSKTRQAVTAYQTVNALTADGLLGRTTWAHLYGQTER